jgi:hypothetical protein
LVVEARFWLKQKCTITPLTVWQQLVYTLPSVLAQSLSLTQVWVLPMPPPNIGSQSAGDPPQ